MHSKIRLPRIASIAFSALGFLASTPHHGNAAELRVPMDFPTIQAALNAAADGDDIQVAPGTYQGNLNFNQKDVRLRSLEGAETTIIVAPAGPSSVPSVRIGPAGLISGFTIRKTLPGPLGSAIIVQGSGSYITSNIIENHRDGLGANGAAINMNSASPVIEKNVFRGNSSISPTTGAGVISLLGNSSP